MALELDTLEEKKAQIERDYESATGQTLPSYGVWFTTIWATVTAGMSKIMDLLVVKAVKDILPSTTRDEVILTDLWGRVTKSPRTLSTQAVLVAAGTGTPGETIPGGINGRQFVHSSGVKFFLQDNHLIPGTGIIDTTVQAFLPGIDGNISSGDLFLTQADPNINGGKLTISSVAIAGQEDESIERWVAAIQRVLRSPVLADNYSYYYAVSRQAGMAAGYAYTDDPGTLDLYVESTNENAYGVPTTTEVQDVTDFFTGDADEDGDGSPDNNVRLPPDLLLFRPDGITKRFRVFASEPTDFYVVVTGATATRQTAIDTAIKAYFPGRKPYVKGAVSYDTGTISQGDLRAIVQGAMDQAGGGTYNEVVLYIADTNTAVGTYPLGRGERARIVAAPGAGSLTVGFE